jgi:hypothetical protein
MTLSAEQFLSELRLRGVTRLRRVSFRRNRSTIWSLTQGGSVLNVHAAYESAPPDLLNAFADLLREGGWGAAGRRRRAASEIRSWPPLEGALREARRSGSTPRESACCATSEQVTYLRALYLYLNRTRFGGLLPDDLPVRLSSRMKSTLGHMLPGEDGVGKRVVVEIALNVDLMLDGNDSERVDTLLHEMAHAADYLLTGRRGHGASWREWARKVGCQPGRLYDRPVRTRRRRTAPVTRVPPPPPPLASFVD